jgi:hypothetical protein
VNSIYLPGTITFSHLAVKKWSLAWAVASALHAISTPYSTSVSVPLYAITARSITNQRTSSGVGIGFTFLPHVIIRDKRYGVHWQTQALTDNVEATCDILAPVINLLPSLHGQWSQRRRRWLSCKDASTFITSYNLTTTFYALNWRCLEIIVERTS